MSNDREYRGLPADIVSIKIIPARVEITAKAYGSREWETYTTVWEFTTPPISSVHTDIAKEKAIEEFKRTNENQDKVLNERILEERDKQLKEQAEKLESQDKLIREIRSELYLFKNKEAEREERNAKRRKVKTDG